ncbi:MAG: hypothetical protein ACPG7F_02255, partial [Aggregatilineales bacterium]
MFQYLRRRLFQGALTFLGVTLLSFLIMQAAPGDPITLITFAPNSDPETAETMRRQLGLDQPIHIQYWYWLVGNEQVLIDIDGDGIGETPGERGGLIRGDLGDSIKQKKPVTELIA